MDLTGAAKARARIAEALGHEVLAISAVTGQGIPALIHRISDMLERGDSAAEGTENPRPTDEDKVNI